MEEIGFDDLTFKTDNSCIGPNNAIYVFDIQFPENYIRISKLAKTGDLSWEKNHPDLIVESGSIKINFDFESNRLIFHNGGVLYVFDIDGNFIEEVDLTNYFWSFAQYIATRDMKSHFFRFNTEEVGADFKIERYGMQVDLITLKVDTLFTEIEIVPGVFRTPEIIVELDYIVNGFKIELISSFEKGDDSYELEYSFRSRVLGFDYSWNKSHDQQIDYDDIPGADSDNTYLDLSYYGKLIKRRIENGGITEASIGDCEINTLINNLGTPREFENGDLLYYNSIYDCNEKIIDLNQKIHYPRNIPNSDTLYSIFRDTLRFIYPEIESSNTESVFKSVVQMYPNPAADMVEFSSLNAIEKIYLITMKGEKSRVKESFGNIDLSAFASGIYLVEFNLKNGKKVIKKLVKE